MAVGQELHDRYMQATCRHENMQTYERVPRSQDGGGVSLESIACCEMCGYTEVL